MLICVYDAALVPILFIWLQCLVAIVCLLISLKLVIDNYFYFNPFYILAKAKFSETKTLLNYCDAENHRPLHSSVIGNSYFIELLHK